MSFSGNVEKKSHEGGLLVAFEGRAPRLGAMIRVVGGKSLGRVNTVIGAVDRALIHIHPMHSEVDAASAIGSPVEIAPNERRQRDDRRGGYERRDRRDSGGYQRNDRRGRDSGRGHQSGGRGHQSGGRGHQSGGQRYERRDDRSGGDQGNRGGDWTCPKCKNSNFAFRTECNRCDAKKPEGAGDRSDGGRGRDGGRGHQSGGRGHQSGGQRYERRDDRSGGDRGNRGGDWTCPKCKNSNFAFRTECNRCDAKKPEGAGDRSDGGRGRDGGRGHGRKDRGGQGGDRGGYRSSDRGGRDGGRSEKRGNDRGGDWHCPKCNNSNFAFRTECNRCDAKKPEGGGSRGGNRGGGSRSDYRGKDRAAGDRRGGDSRGGNRGGGGRSNYRGKDRAAGDRRGGDSRGGNRGGDSRGNYRRDDRSGDGPRGGDRGGFQPRSDRSGPSRGRSPGSRNRPRRSGFRGSNKGKDKS